MKFRILFFMLPVAIAGCITDPTITDITPHTAQIEKFSGQRIRWGGSIVSTEPGKNETCFEVMSYPLGTSPRLPETDMRSGRFIACALGFYEPEVYARGREVTIIGTIQGTIVRKLGEYDYSYPKINAESVYLWQKPAPYYGTPNPAKNNGLYGLSTLEF